MAINGKYPVLLVSTSNPVSAEEMKAYRKLKLQAGNMTPDQKALVEKVESELSLDNDYIDPSQILTTAFPIVFDGSLIKAVVKSYASSMTKQLETVGNVINTRSMANTVNIQITYKAEKTLTQDPLLGIPTPTVIDSIIALSDWFYSQPDARPLCSFIGGSVVIPSGYLVGVSHGESENTEEGTITLTIQKNPVLSEKSETAKTPAKKVDVDQPLAPKSLAPRSFRAIPVPKNDLDAPPDVREFDWYLLEKYSDIDNKKPAQYYSEYTYGGDLIRFDKMQDRYAYDFGFSIAISVMDYTVNVNSDGTISASNDKAIAAIVSDEMILLGVSKTVVPKYTPESSGIAEAAALEVVEKLPVRIIRDNLTPYVGMSWDVGRLKSYMSTQLGSLYYAPEIGFDWSYWFNDKVEFQNKALVSWLTNEAMNRAGIMTSHIGVTVEDFMLKIDYEVASSFGCNGLNSAYWTF